MRIVSAEGTVGTAGWQRMPAGEMAEDAGRRGGRGCRPEGWQRMPAGGVLTGLRCVHSETERLTKKILHFVQNDSLVSFRGR